MPSARVDVTLIGPHDATSTGTRFQSASTFAGPTVTTGASGGTVTHGSQITTANTGWGAYFDPTLGRNVVSTDLVTVATTSVSSLIATYGLNISKKHFTNFLVFDQGSSQRPTFTACQFDSGINAYNGGTRYPFDINYCTVGPTINNDAGTQYAVGDANFTATRCRLGGGTDGADVQVGTISITECYITVYNWAGAHMDGFQSFGASLGICTLQRNHVVCGGQNGSVDSNSGWQFADDSTGTYRCYDNFFEAVSGGQPAYIMRCNDGTMDVQGNWVLSGAYQSAPAFAYYGGSGDPGVTFSPGFGATRPNLIVTANGDGTYSQVAGSGTGYTGGVIGTP
jgi:hypothetical protein